MPVQYNNVSTRPVYYHMSTTNKSFLEMHYYLKDKGIQKNKFMLALIDPDLHAIDPFDPNLPLQYKLKITREVTNNYWYFIRETVRIPNSGGTVGGGAKYKLHRGNLALSFCMLFNINTMMELPRQQGKTISAVCWYLYLFNFGTRNANIAFLNKKFDDSKYNLQLMRNVREALPTYLQMDKFYDVNGKQIRKKDTVETLQHPTNMNKIQTVPSARNKVNAANLLRGRTLPLIWFDEYAFIPYNNIVYTNMVPAFKTAANNARRNMSHYGILITTTPGFLTNDEGVEAYSLKESATKFSESWYDLSYAELRERLDCNNNSDFVYIRYTYQQLGCDETWFRETCRTLRNNWDAIRREVLLEWSEASENCPFRKEDLEIIRVLTKAPIQKIPMLGGKYEFNIYENTFDIVHYPPIIGVDVSGGYNRDSSAITVIDSRTTKVIADFNCNYISIPDLAALIYELVTKYMPNAVVNIERNGGYGASVVSQLVTTRIKRNLFYEDKERVFEESFDKHGHIQSSKKIVRSYGVNSTKETRDLIMEILRSRVENHKDKFVSRRIFDEMQHMEVKRSGKIEHSVNTHDDQVFSYLWALYVWYEGKNLMDAWGIRKESLQTDANIDEAVMTIDEEYKPIYDEVMSEINEEVQAQLDQLNTVKATPFRDWMKQERENDQAAMVRILSTPLGKQAYANTYNTTEEDVDNGFETIPDSVFGVEDEDNIADRFNLRQFTFKD